ncbi:hypothetical protein [Pseudomonas chlororaphis]|uniref:hypothetical protein n=1 Tax=Pseudomonas chlororaphis TaxID=587753 RepID=UPI001268E25E|nr:hypothetical protein [Pseudomonas chlororaphis]
MTVVGEKSRMEGKNSILKKMRVFPPDSRNIRNIFNDPINYLYKSNRYIENPHLDNRNKSGTLPEHTGTIGQRMFRKCSGYEFFRNIAAALVDEGLQSFFANPMFRNVPALLAAR